MISYIIPICVDKPEKFNERRKSLLFVLGCIKRQTVLPEIILVEQYIYNKPFYEADAKAFGVKYISLKWRVFNKSWCCNVGARAAKGDVVIGESDVAVLDVNYIKKLEEYSKDKKWVIGWNRIAYTDQVEKAAILDMKNGDIKNWHNCEKGKSEGGVVWFNRDFYFDIGGMNEYYEGWGCDDNDIARRAEYVSKEYNNMEADIYHLYHQDTKYKAMQIRERNGIWYSKMLNKIPEVISFIKSKAWGNADKPLSNYIVQYQSLLGGGRAVDFNTKKEIIRQMSLQNAHRIEEKANKIAEIKVASAPTIKAVEKKTDGPKLSIIAAVKNNVHYTAMFLSDIYYNTVNPFEVVIVNNGSTDSTLELCKLYKERYGNLSIVDAAGVNNISRLWNMGVGNSTGEVLVICNNDIALGKRWDESMMVCLGSDTNYAVVCPTSNFASTHQKPKCKEDLKPENIERVNSYLREHGKYYSAIFTLSGFFMMFKKDLLKLTGNFYEEFELGMFEDNYFFKMVLRAGLRPVVDGTTYIHHYGSKTFQAEGVDTGKLFETNREKFAKLGL